ncbi:hypothetical protein BDD12DRAFT_36197 [Trichophaea hybrida]|nr:hypothetical protein BDD12DRAFT_36197 [Trichophaea hybrida]
MCFFSTWFTILGMLVLAAVSHLSLLYSLLTFYYAFPRINYDSPTEELLIKMPTELHDSAAARLNNETNNMVLELRRRRQHHDSTCRMIGVYRNSVKQPDVTLWADDPSLFPAVVVEAGHSESLPRLRSNYRLWFLGSAFEVTLPSW